MPFRLISGERREAKLKFSSIAGYLWQDFDALTGGSLADLPQDLTNLGGALQ